MPSLRPWNQRNPIVGLNKEKIEGLIKLYGKYRGIININSPKLLSIESIYPQIQTICENIRPKILQKLIIHKTLEACVQARLLQKLALEENENNSYELSTLLQAMIEDGACISGSQIFAAMYPSYFANDLDIFVPCGAKKLLEWFTDPKNCVHEADRTISGLYNPSNQIPISEVMTYTSKFGIIQLIFVHGDPREHIFKWFDLDILKNTYDGHTLTISYPEILLSKRIEIRQIPRTWNTPFKMLSRLFKYTREYTGFKVYVSNLDFIPRNPGWPNDVSEGKNFIPNGQDLTFVKNLDQYNIGKRQNIDEKYQPKVVVSEGKTIILSYDNEYLREKLGNTTFHVLNYSVIQS